MAAKRGAIVVTGASSGIGRAIARLLTANGWRVFAGVRSLADGEALRAECPEFRMPLRMDVTDRESILAAAEEVKSVLGGEGLAGLVNNAGVAVTGPLEFVPLEDFKRQLQVNVTGPLAVTQAFLPLLRQGRGRIVNMGSISGLFASPMLGPYAASKYALEALTDALRRELAGQGIQVSIIEPGPVATPIWEKSRQSFHPGHSVEAQALYGRMTRATERYTAQAEARAIPAEEVARTVLHALAALRPRTRYLVGQKVRWEALAARLLPDRLLDWLIARSLAQWDSTEP